MGRLGHTLSTLRPVGRPTRTQDSLPAAGQALPGGLDGPLGSSERFRAVCYISPPFPGFAWRKRASVPHASATPPRTSQFRRFTAVTSTEATEKCLQGSIHRCTVVTFGS